jgi:hypothetical protein
MPENKELLETMESGIKSIREDFNKQLNEQDTKFNAELNEKLEGLKSLSTKEEVEAAVKSVSEELQSIFI